MQGYYEVQGDILPGTDLGELSFLFQLPLLQNRTQVGCELALGLFL